MDQDSQWENFSDFLNNTIHNPKAPIGLWGPWVNSNGSGYNDFRPCLLINSGMLQSIELIRMANGWNEYFKIEAVDIDYCLKLRQLGVLSFMVKGGRLIQNYGKEEWKSFFGRKFHINNYSPERLFYIYRNHLLLIRKYKDAEDLRKIYWRLWIVHNIRVTVFGEKQKIKKIFAILKGILSGLLSRIPN